MSKTLQDIGSISPIDAKEGDKKSTDPIKAEYEQGKKLLEKSNYGQAALSFHNVLLGYEEKGDEPGIANASNQLGHTCLAKGDFEAAEKHYQRAADICEKLTDPLSVFAIKKKFVEVYRGKKEYTRAVDVCLDLLDIYHANNDPKGTVALLEQMAEMYIEWDKPAKAADTYRTISSIHRNFKHQAIADSFEAKAQELDSTN